MFKSVEVQPIFPTYIWVHDLEPALAGRLNPQLETDLMALTGPLPPLQPGQNWQTDQVLHQRPQFKELIDIFSAAAKQILDILEVDYREFMVTGCWANINPRTATHRPHTHPNNYLSGVYYVKADAGGDSISFHDPRPQQNIIAPPMRRPNQYNAAVSNLKVQPGRLILFPAWLTHSVTANLSDQLRISISLNLMFLSYAETMSQPKWQGMPLRDDADTPD